MAFKNKVISNPKTLQSICFLQTGKDTNGQLLEMESTYKAQSKEPPPHYHPHQEEQFAVISGELTVRIGGALKVLQPGDSLHIPKNVVHSMWNNSGAPVVVNWRVQPALHTEHLLETIAGLAEDGRTNADGRPGLLQLALTAGRYSEEFRLATPSFAVQKTLFSLLKPVARLMGFQPTYRHHLD